MLTNSKRYLTCMKYEGPASTQSKLFSTGYGFIKFILIACFQTPSFSTLQCACITPRFSVSHHRNEQNSTLYYSLITDRLRLRLLCFVFFCTHTPNQIANAKQHGLNTKCNNLHNTILFSLCVYVKICKC